MGEDDSQLPIVKTVNRKFASDQLNTVQTHSILSPSDNDGLWAEEGGIFKEREEGCRYHDNCCQQSGMPLIPDLASIGMRGPRRGNHGLESRTDGHAFHRTGDMMATSPPPLV
ncbi:hypothetical protein TNCV_3832301 [Trichonephila clavipes]|nr:hypothetical protein TNCV_3832301 [Trichonephila clavipes]